METQVKTMNPVSNLQVIHKVPAGALPADHSIELFADRAHRKLYFMTGGQTYPFAELPMQVKQNIFRLLRSDRVAFEDLKNLRWNEALERYAYCMFGGVDSDADFNADGSLGVIDNFQCGIENCNCRNWERKQVLYQGRVIQGRLLDVLMAYRSGGDDQHVADALGISLSTLFAHKKRLFNIFRCYSKTEMVVSAIEAKIFQ